MKLLKYPRTQHLQGSRVQPGDEDLNCVAFETIKGRKLVVEEKMDGANSAICFDKDGKMHLQSRGHYLTGGGREKHFNLFKTWANSHREAFWQCLGSRYIAYGEWLYAKHTIFYDQLPHYWMEFDVYDRHEQEFLSTERRRSLFKNTPVLPVRVIFEGTLDKLAELASLLGPSAFIGAQHLQVLLLLCQSQNISVEQAMKETDQCTFMEGLYIKIEEDGSVKQRYKFIRPSFLSTVLSSESHWLNRPILPNQLLAGANIFEV